MGLMFVSCKDEIKRLIEQHARYRMKFVKTCTWTSTGGHEYYFNHGAGKFVDEEQMTKMIQAHLEKTTTSINALYD